MKTYLVGGAVRDRLLGFPVKEFDWLVLGETAESMHAKGFLAVGKDFPVFLHPVTRDEYALARTERKTGHGYKGFAVYAAPDVTLEEDLQRRDLTINAMALDNEDRLIDPFGGRRDLENRVLRHVSPAFGEDPVRILRVARFAARYAHLGFTVAAETRELIRRMAVTGEANHLVPERVWSELHKAIMEATPSAFFNVLRECGALAAIFPEIDALFGIPQPARHHPEIDTGVHVLMVLDQAALLSEKAEVRLAALLHDLGKALTPSENWPSHHGHEKNGLVVLHKFCERLRVPKIFKTLCMHVMQYHTHCHRALELRTDTLTDFLGIIGAFKSNSNLENFILACEADARGRLGFENTRYPQAEFIRSAAKAGISIDTSAVTNGNLQGEQIGAAIRQLRIAAIDNLIRQNQTTLT